MVAVVAVNYMAVIAATVVSFIIGFLWYGPLFGRQWIGLMGFTSKDMKKAKEKGMAKAAITGFIAQLVMTFVLAVVLGLAQPTNILEGLMVGFLLWIGFVATIMLGGVLWEGKKVQLYVLNVIHYLVVFLVSSAILVAWI